MRQHCLHSNHIRVISRKAESCVSKKVVVDVQSFFIHYCFSFSTTVQNLRSHSSFNLFHSSVSTDFRTPISSYWKIFFCLFLPSSPVVQFRHAQTSRRWRLYPPRWVQVHPTEQKSRTHEEPTQPQTECGNAGGGGRKDDGQPRPWEHHHVCSHCAKHGEDRLWDCSIN